MAKIETLTAYKCSFGYLQRNNPLKEELQDKIKAEIPPEYTLENFINDFCEYTSSLAIGTVTERAILLPEENIFPRKTEDKIKKWRIVPYAGNKESLFVLLKQLLVKNTTLVRIVRHYMSTISLCTKAKIL